MMRYRNPELRQLLAAEYVLGTLKGRARQRFQAQLSAHPELRRRVRCWEHDLAELMGPVPAVPPPAEVWSALQQRLFPASRPTPWFERLRVWHGLALGSGLLAGILALFLAISPAPDGPDYLALINDAGQRPVWLISSAANQARLTVRNIRPVRLPVGKRCVLWLQPNGSQTLHPVGVLPEQGDVASLVLDEALRGFLPGRLLVTIEAMSDVLPATPTGPPEFQGAWYPTDPEAGTL